ncbi:MAG: T9SS type A sorting domain-containing protein [Candidatus Marinimicrobia bacterium]|jgi:hypothetical protein|nr:T9SS type A sorting domain-containing protein [Candidatus Neomarinimicrobiota bacterium]MBT3633837.1 T9SS type A sorting domain-containing protein [Candidatus Neomarinimicrobiota bacterium]MBT3682629.1 T9SS type A sorting domain-containing protein [Candidatus Neomarinimicrobiota bacterium]MBT3759393.1 T9SS type A sorting domain-containing protein [Candidatus Neomarinimicrobiota bacterium]MBT3894599.1 T9SS type A sorting domain-containing protein [Candidatus Neomarinimicrobiota bacterium]
MNNIQRIFHKPINLILVPLICIGVSTAFSEEPLSNQYDGLRSFDSGSFSGNRVYTDLENNGMVVSHRISGHSGMEWPAGTAMLSNFASGIWFAGVVDGSIRTAVAEYGSELVPGPWEGDYNLPEHQLYIVNRSDLTDPLSNSDFQNWPTHLGAPWVDEDGDGVYSPLPSGPDHPDFIGDQVIWYVINDGDVATHSNIFGTQPLGIEVRITIWGYNRSDVFGDMVFVKAQAFNKGGDDITNMFIGLWDDPDLGDAGDDFVGCDTTLNLGFCYNDGSDMDYGVAPPALGYDIFQAAVPGDASDETFAFGEMLAGYTNLPMSSFVKYINGDMVYVDPNNAQEAYNYMSGVLRDGTPIIDSETGMNSKFVHPCDPNDNTGFGDGCWVDSDDHNSGDRRFLMNVGPFNFDNGDSLELVFGIMHAQGNNSLSSVTALKQVDHLAQLAYDIQFSSAEPPPQPNLIVTSTNTNIVNEWDDVAEGYTVIDPINLDEYGNPTIYQFEGYNLWQFENIDGSGEKYKLATFDIVNGVTEIYDYVFDFDWGVDIFVPVQDGSDSGIQRSFSLSFDYLNASPLFSGQHYYLGISAYAYSPTGIPNTLESQPEIFDIVFLETLNFDLEETVDPDFQINPSDNIDSYISLEVINPMEVTGHEYQVEFGYFMYQEDLGFEQDCAGDWYSPETGPIHALDCAGNCGDLSWIGDGWCDDPNNPDYSGQYWNCEAWDWDGGDCFGEDEDSGNHVDDRIPYSPSELVDRDEESTFLYWQVYDLSIGEYVTVKQPVQGGINQVTGEYVGYNTSPIFDGIQVVVYTPSQGLHGIWQTANADGDISGIDENINEDIMWIHFLSAPDYPTEQSQGGWAFVTHGGGTPNDLDSFYNRVFRGDNWSRVQSNDFEMRFTADALINGMGYRRFDDQAIMGNVPFELWNLGSSPNDESDDYRMLPAILNGTTWGWFDDVNAFDLWGDDPNSSGDNDPSSDYVYWGNPDDMSPGTGGYDSFFSPGIGNNPNGGWTEVMARTRIMNWNRYLGGGGGALDSAAAELAMPEVGTIIRWITNKPISASDIVNFTSPSIYAFNEIFKGDIDDDGQITIGDLDASIEIVLHVPSDSVFTFNEYIINEFGDTTNVIPHFNYITENDDETLFRADLNLNNQVDIGDVVSLGNMLVGSIDIPQNLISSTSKISLDLNNSLIKSNQVEIPVQLPDGLSPRTIQFITDLSSAEHILDVFLEFTEQENPMIFSNDSPIIQNYVVTKLSDSEVLPSVAKLIINYEEGYSPAGRIVFENILLADINSEQIIDITPDDNSISLEVLFPQKYELAAPYPNPFNSSISISFTVPYPSQVKINVYDLLGREVLQLVNETLNQGSYSHIWGGLNTDGISVASGLYMIKMESGNYIGIQHITLLK